MPAVVSKNKIQEESSRNKFQLTELQKEYLQLILPKFMGLRLTDLTDEKRNRTPKKTEQIYDTEFFNQGNRSIIGASSSHPKNEKKISTKEKEKMKDKKEEEKSSKNLQDKVNEENKKTDPRRARLSKEIEGKKQALQKNLKEPERKISPKRKQRKHSDFEAPYEPERIKKQMVENREQRAEMKENERKVYEKKNLSEKQEKIEYKKVVKDKKIKQIIKIESTPHEQNQSHSFAPIHSKEQHSVSNEGQKNLATSNRFSCKINANEENPKRENILNMNSILHISENQAEYNHTDLRQLSPPSKLFCKKFLNKLKQYKASWPFRIPVDPVTQGVPNYLQIVHRPMDLKTIEKKLSCNEYEHVSEFHGDVNKIFLNSYKFNPRETNYFTLTVQLQAYYYYLIENIEINPSFLDVEQSTKIKSSRLEQDFTEETPLKKKKTTLNSKKSGKVNSKNLSMKDKDSSEANKDSLMEDQNKNRRNQMEDNVQQNILQPVIKKVKAEEFITSKNIQKDKESDKNLFEGMATPKKLPKIPSVQQKSSNKKKYMKEDLQFSHKNSDHSMKEIKKFSYEQKKNLAEKIKKLSPVNLESILGIIYGEDYVNNSEMEKDFQIELNELPQEVLKRLDSYVREKEISKSDEPTCLQKYFLSDERLYLFDPFPGTF